MPSKMWQKIRLKKSYAEALAQVWLVVQPVGPVHEQAPRIWHLVCSLCTKIKSAKPETL